MTEATEHFQYIVSLPYGLQFLLKNQLIALKEFPLLTKVHITNAMVFPVVMYRCELDHKSTEELMLLSCGAEKDS